MVGILYELVEVKSSVLLQLGQHFGLTEDVGQLEDDRPEEGNLVDDDVYFLHRLSRKYLRHDEFLRYEIFILLLKPNRVYIPTSVLYLGLEHFHQIL